MEGRNPCRSLHVAQQELLDYPRSLPGGEAYKAVPLHFRDRRAAFVPPQETNALLSHRGISCIAGRLRRHFQRDQNQNQWTEPIPIDGTFHETRKSPNRGRCYHKEATVEWKQSGPADHNRSSSQTLFCGFPRKRSICYSAILAIPQPSSD